MDPLLLSVISVTIAVAMAVIQIRKYFSDKKSADRADMEKEFRAPAERDSIIISGAKEVVAVLRETLADKVIEIDQLRDRALDQDARIRFLEQELARLHYKEEKPNE